MSIQQYKDKDYKAVIKTWQSLRGANNREKFLAASAFHETGDYQQAVNVLQQIVQNNSQTGNRLYNDEAEFYLGLSYLKMKNNKAAYNYFKKIRDNPNHTFHERVSRWTITRLKWLN
jgi:tetratricopeptide (TPR) repeat protein